MRKMGSPIRGRVRRGGAGLLMFAAFFFAGSTMQPTAGEEEQFYKGRRLVLTVGVDAGGSYDQYARLLARHMPKYIPGHPGIIVQNLPGAAGLKAAQKLASVSPRDG